MIVENVVWEDEVGVTHWLRGSEVDCQLSASEDKSFSQYDVLDDFGFRGLAKDVTWYQRLQGLSFR